MRLESSAHGSIEQMLLAIPSWVLRYQRQVEIKPVADVYRSLLQTLPEPVRFIVVTHEESRELLQEWLQTAGAEKRTDLFTVPDRSGLSVWTEDLFVVCRDAGGSPLIIESAPQVREARAAVVAQVAAEAGWERRVSPLSFQSGNLLVGDDFWFIGADSLQETRALAGADAGTTGDSDSRDEYRSTLDTSRRLHVIDCRVPVAGFSDRLLMRPCAERFGGWQESLYRGNQLGTSQPLFHIDTFITLAGRRADGGYNVLVGDPRLAADALDVPLWDHAAADAFDDVARQLAEAGFHVIRNPLPLAFEENTIDRVRHWYYATSNNALVAIDGRRKQVWLPAYGYGDRSALQTTDRLNREIWEDLGFETFCLGDFHTFAMNLGAARCMAKALLRSPQESASGLQ